MTSLVDIHNRLQQDGFRSTLIDVPDEPYHVAVTFNAPGVEEELILRINQLEHADGLLDIWQLIVVFPTQAVSPLTFQAANSMLNGINVALPFGKALPAEQQQMFYYRYNHMTAAGLDAGDSLAPVITMIVDFISAMAADLADVLLDTSVPEEEDMEEIQTALNEVQSSLMALMQEIEELEALQDDDDD